MKLDNIRIIKSDKRGVIYDCGPSSFIVRKKGTISAGHVHQDPELLYLVKGRVQLTIGNETKVVKAPIKFRVKANEYHRLVALTNIELVIQRKNE